MVWKNGTNKRFFSLLVVAALILTMLPVTGIAAEEPEQTDAVYDATDLEQTAEETTEETEILLPETVQFLAADSGAFQVGSNYYADLSTALENAVSGDVVAMIAADYTVVESLDIPSGVTLLLPYSDSVLTMNESNANHPYANSGANGTTNSWSKPGSGTLHTLTLGEDVTLTVGSGAKLILGGQYASSSSGLSGQTYGAHSDMVLSEGSQLLVTEGGILSCVGYITGDGEVVVNNGGEVYEPFVVTDFHGGSYTAVMYNTNKMTPFNSYAMFNIQVPVTMDSNSYLWGYCDLFANKSHNTTTALIAGASDALLNLGEGTTLRSSYDESGGVSEHFGIGKTSLCIDGDATMGMLSLKVSGITVKTSSVTFPIPYHFSISQQAGTLSIAYPVKLLPGAEVKIGRDAALNLTSKLLVYDGLVSPKYSSSAKAYPSGAQLSAAGQSERARLIVDGTLNIGSGAVFAGTVETSGDGVISVDSAATLGASVTEGGCSGDSFFFGMYKLSTTTKTAYEIVARVGDYHNPGAYLEMAAGTTYYGVTDDVVEYNAGYTYVHYTDSSTKADVDVIYDTEEAICGTWATEQIHLCKKSVELTAATLSTCVTHGHNAYYTCTVCGLVYKDEMCTQSTAVEEEALPLKEHTYTEDDAHFTWQTDYSAAVVTVPCSVCGEDNPISSDCEISCEWDAATTTLKFAVTATIGSQTFTDDSEYIRLTKGDGVLTVEMSLIGTDDEIDMRIVVAGYMASEQMTSCQIEDSVINGSEIELTVTGDYIKVFFLRPDGFDPLVICVTL